MGNPSDILRSAGIPDLPIEMASSRLKHKSNQESHPFDLLDVENMPLSIQRPLAVFDSKTRSGHKVILTELKFKGANFVVALQMNSHPFGYKRNVEVNDIRVSMKETQGLMFLKMVSIILMTTIRRYLLVSLKEKKLHMMKVEKLCAGIKNGLRALIG